MCATLDVVVEQTFQFALVQATSLLEMCAIVNVVRAIHTLGC